MQLVGDTELNGVGGRGNRIYHRSCRNFVQFPDGLREERFDIGQPQIGGYPKASDTKTELKRLVQTFLNNEVGTVMGTIEM